MQLYDYQSELITELYQLEKEHNKIAFCAATGSGKSVMLSHICQNAIAANQKVLILVHRKLLVDQLAETLQKFGIQCGYIKAGYNYDSNKIIYVASIATLARRQIDVEFDRIIIDEAHVVGFAKATTKTLDTYPNAKVTMFTATPFPSSRKRNLYNLCTAEVVAPTPKELMDRGFLSYDEYYSFPTYHPQDIDNLKINTYGEYDTSELGKMCRNEASINNVVKEYIRLAGNKKGVSFAADVAHSKALCEAFNKAGIRAVHIDGKTPDKERLSVYSQFKAGNIDMLINCSVLTEGADFPSIECVILPAPYRSKARYIQAVGRGLRVSEGKKYCLILDHGQNAIRLGKASDLTKHDYRLKEWKTSNKQSNCEPITKACPKCYAVNYAIVKKCKECGYEFPFDKEEDTRAIIGELQRLNTETKDLPVPSLAEMRKEYANVIKMSFYGKKSAGMPMAVWYKKYAHYKIKDLSAITQHALLGTNPNNYHLNKFANWIMDYIIKKSKTIDDYKTMIVRELGALAYNEEIKLVLNKVWMIRKNELTRNSTKDS